MYGSYEGGVSNVPTAAMLAAIALRVIVNVTFRKSAASFATGLRPEDESVT
jgi:hypothetical protein